MSKTTELVWSTVEETIHHMGYELVDVELAREGKSLVLSIYIDRAGGVTVEDCEMVSRMVDPMIEELDPIVGTYYLSVSSPGLDRPFKKPEDYRRALQTEVEVNLYRPVEGEKHFVGRLVEYQEETGTIVVGTEKGSIELEKSVVSRIRPWVKFD